MRLTTFFKRDASAKRRGASATEFAIVLPVLITFCLAGVDFGRHTHTSMALSNAARVGSERGSIKRVTTYTRPTWEADVRAAVLEELTNIPDYNAADVTVAITNPTSTYVTSLIKVEVSAPFRTIVSWPFVAQPVTIRRSVTMCEYR